MCLSLSRLGPIPEDGKLPFRPREGAEMLGQFFLGKRARQEMGKENSFKKCSKGREGWRRRVEERNNCATGSKPGTSR